MRRHTPAAGVVLPCGVHKLRLRRRDLSIDYETEVTLTPGQEFRRAYRIGSAE